MEKEKGITLVSLIIMIILMLILVSVVIKISRDAVDKSKLENLKTDMLLIQGKAKMINEKFGFKDIESLTGLKYVEATPPTEYVLTDNFKTVLNTTTTDKYIWQQADLDANGLRTIKIDNNKFYVVDYTSNEIYYSLGYTKDGTTYYKLSEIQTLR